MRVYELSKQKNIRDLGGLKGYQGKTVKYGRLFRGGALDKVSQEDVEILKTLNITDIVDFRSKEEFVYRPDYWFENVKYHNFTTFEHEHKKEDIKHDDGNLLWFMDQGDTGFQHLYKTYLELVDTDEAQRAYANFFEVIMSDDKRVVYFHCSQGKDRVGLAAYFIESALGVSEEDKIEDYLLSNIAMEKRHEALINSVKDRPFYNEQYKNDLIEVFSAKLEYLKGALELINSKYGGVESYIKNVLHVDIDKFRAMFLE